MYQQELSENIYNGIIDKIGHAPFALLAVVVEKARRKGYPRKLEISIREQKYKGKFNNYNHLKKARDILKKEGLIEDYQNKDKSEIGTFFLKYD